MTPVPMFALGTEHETDRLRAALGHLCGREIALSEDVTATVTEAVEAVQRRLAALEARP